MMFEIWWGICLRARSLPARGAWIEIGVPTTAQFKDPVAPHKGSVD